MNQKIEIIQKQKIKIKSQLLHHQTMPSQKAHFYLRESLSPSYNHQSSFNLSLTTQFPSLLHPSQPTPFKSLTNQSNQLHLGSLIKSKQSINKLSNKLEDLFPKRKDIQIIKGNIQGQLKQIHTQIDKRIEGTFSKLINTDMVMNIHHTINHNQSQANTQLNYQNTQLNQQSNTQLNHQSKLDKENYVPQGITVNQGTDYLMLQYWHTKNLQKQKQKLQPIVSSTIKGSQNNTKGSQTVVVSRALSKKHLKIILPQQQAKHQQLLKSKDQQLKLQFSSFKMQIIEYKIQNQTKQFLLFQRVNYKKWEDIQFLINCLVLFTQKYQIQYAVVALKKILDLVEAQDTKQQVKINFQRNNNKNNNHHNNNNNTNNHNSLNKGNNSKNKTLANPPSLNISYTMHQLLSCFDQPDKISQKNAHKPGIRFYGIKGKKRSIIKIQSHIRKWICKKKFKQLKQILKKVIFIQRKFRSFSAYSKTKQQILEVNQQKLLSFKCLQKTFQQNYRRCQITKKIKYQVHICSISSTQWVRVTTQSLNEIQNLQISRIFRLVSSSLIQTRIIYIAPCALPLDVFNYYKKLFQFGSQQQIDLDQKLYIVWPENVEKLPDTLSLTKKLMYSKLAIRRIKRLLRNQYGYIVPSTNSMDYVHLCHLLQLPLYAAQPQKMLYLQTKAGNKQFQKGFKKQTQDGIGYLPYSINVYNKQGLVSQLAQLVFRYPKVKRWILKIDNQYNSRGLANIDTSKIIKSQLRKRITQSKSVNQQKNLKKQVHTLLHKSLIKDQSQVEHIIPLTRQIYPNQQQYLNHFLTNGGIIEASINNFQTDLELCCFCVEIQPDYQWKFIANYQKLTDNNKTIGCYYNSNAQLCEPPLQIHQMVTQLISKGMFGFFTFEFMRIPPIPLPISNLALPCTPLLYFASLTTHLTPFSCISFLKSFISPTSSLLYIPKLHHPCLKSLRMQTFFHLCRLENISFDMERKLGNVFMFLGGLETGVIGVTCFNATRKQTYQQLSDVLHFFGNKISHDTKQLDRTFLAIRNVVNGYLKKQQRKHTKNSAKTLNSAQSLTNLTNLI